MKINLIRTFAILSLFIASAPTLAQGPAGSAQLCVDQDESALISQLAKLATRYQTPVGLELSIRDSGASPSAGVAKRSEVTGLETDLNNLTTRFSGYQWNVSDGVVSVFPSESDRDIALTTFLDSRAEHVDMKSRTSAFELKRRIAESRNVDAVLASHGLTLLNELDFETDHAPFYRSFSAVFEDKSVREILNDVVTRAPVLMWVSGRDGNRSGLFIDFVLCAERL